MKEVKIGNQIWMAENLNVDKFRNGDPIPQAKTNEEWEKAGKMKKPVWCYYDNDPSNGKLYGKLYNWYAVNDKRELAPKGWHISSHQEWDKLVEFLGGGDEAGKKLKAKYGYQKDGGYNGNGSDEFCFSALPGGYRYLNGLFTKVGRFAMWWCSTEDNATNAWIRDMGYDGDYVARGTISKSLGNYIRCLKD